MNECTELTMSAAAGLAGLGWVELATALAGLAAGVVALFQKRKRCNAEGALDGVERIVIGLISAIEVWKRGQAASDPGRRAADDLLEKIRALQEGLGSEGELRRLVLEVRELIGGLDEASDDTGRRARAETAAAAYLERRRPGSKSRKPKPRKRLPRPGGGVWPTLLLIVAVLLGALGSGCALSGCGERDWTTETVAGWDEDGAVVVVEWPAGVRASDVWTTETEGRTQTMSWVDIKNEEETREPSGAVEEESPPAE